MAAQTPADALASAPHEVTGWSCTRVDCPECGEINYAEGDARGDTIRCSNPDCGAALFVVTVV